MKTKETVERKWTAINSIWFLVINKWFCYRIQRHQQQYFSVSTIPLRRKNEKKQKKIKNDSSDKMFTLSHKVGFDQNNAIATDNYDIIEKKWKMEFVVKSHKFNLWVNELDND